MLRMLIGAVWLLLAQTLGASALETVSLKAADGLTITADVYRSERGADAPWIVLAHMASASRGEYRDIAPRLVKLGFNAIALDQRSGSNFAGVANETEPRAARAGLDTSFRGAKPDLLAGIAWARTQSKSGKVILWGSSYSAALTLVIAGENPEGLIGAIAMSPGEYLRGISVKAAAARIKVPVLIASAASERDDWQALLDAVPGRDKTGFTPRSGGRHGSSNLIASLNSSSEAYWQAVEPFLARLK